MNSMKKIVLIQDGGASVSLDDLVHESGLDKDSIRRLISVNLAEIEEKSCVRILNPNIDSRRLDANSSPALPRYTSGINSNQIRWSDVVLNKRQANYLLMLMKNTKQVKKFKSNLESQFYAMEQYIIQDIIDKKNKELEYREQELNDCLLEAKTKVVQKDKYIDVLVEERDGKQQEVNRLKKAVSSKSKFREYDGKHGALSKYVRDRGLKIDVSDLFDYLEFKGWVGTTIVEEKKRFMTVKGIARNGGQPDKSVPVFSFSELDKTVKTKEFEKFMNQFVNIKKKRD